jgi:hypothetical protein
MKITRTILQQASLIVCLVLVSCLYANAQITFEKKFHPFSQQYGRAIFQIPDSGYFLQGTIEKGWRNCYLMRTDKFGDTLWTKTYGTDSIQYFAYDMATTNDGGYVICGDYQTVLTFPSMDSYVQKIDSNGNEAWFNLFGWPNSLGGSKDHGQMVKTLSSGDVIVQGATKDLYFGVGNYQSLGFGWRSYLAKFDGSGSLLDITTVCLKTDTACPSNYCAIDIETIGNNIFWIGSSLFPLYPNQGTLKLAAFDSNLDTLFTKSGFPYSYSGLSKTSDGHLLLFGEGIITKMDTLGNIVWNQTSASTGIPYEITESPSGEYFDIAGDDFADPFSADFYNTYTQAVYINKYTPLGIFNGTFTISPPPLTNQLGYRLVLTLDQGFAFIGYSDNDIWFVKTDSLGNIYTSLTENNTPYQSLTLAPNPATSMLSVKSVEPLTNIKLYDLFGNIVISTDCNKNTIELNVTSLQTGIYLMRVESLNGKVASAKLIITDN